MDILKDFEQTQTTALADGAALDAAFQRRVEQGTPMPTAYEYLDDWGNELVKIYHPEQQVFCQYKAAMTREGTPCTFFAKNVWFRTVLDHVKIFPWKNKKAALIIDFKTGVPKDDMVQLALYADMAFREWPEVEAVRTEYWWTKVKDKTVEIFTRDDMQQLWDVLLPELAAMEKAYNNTDYPPKRNGLCKEYCDVTSCEHHGKYAK